MRTLKEKLKDALGKLKQAATKISTLKQQNEGYAREISTLKQENSVHVDRIAETDATGAEGGAGSADVLAWEAKCADLERTHAALTLGLKAQNTDMRKKLQTYELAAALADEGVALGPSGEEKQGQEQEQRRMAVDKVCALTLCVFVGALLLLCGRTCALAVVRVQCACAVGV